MGYAQFLHLPLSLTTARPLEGMPSPVSACVACRGLGEVTAIAEPEEDSPGQAQRSPLRGWGVPFKDLLADHMHTLTHLFGGTL